MEITETVITTKKVKRRFGYLSKRPLYGPITSLKEIFQAFVPVLAFAMSGKHKLMHRIVKKYRTTPCLIWQQVTISQRYLNQ